MTLTKAEKMRPNILFIMSDDHAAKSISCYGGGLNHTPNLDRIAQEGMRFDHCYVTNSICTPSRATILTGQHNHVNGVQTLVSEIDNRLPNVAKQLRGYGGYQTAMFGKWHLGEGPAHEPRGFDEWEVVPGQGLYFDPVFHTPSGPKRERGYATDIITDKTIDYIARRDKSRPFFVMCHHKAPHRSWECHPKHRELFQHEIKAPDTYTDDYKNRAKAAAAAKMRVEVDMTYLDLGLAMPDGGADEVGDLMAPDYPFLTDRKVPMPEDVTKMRPLIDRHTGETFTFQTREELSKWKYQRYMQRYLRTVQSIDDNVGRLLDFLDGEDLSSKTMVVYTSDQGFFLGEHGWFDKRFIYEESFQMPFLIKGPGVQPGTVSSDIISNVDFAPTWLEYAGLRIPDYMQGTSFARSLRGENYQSPDAVAYHRYWMHGDCIHNAYAHYGIRSKRYKIIFWYAEGYGLPGTSPGGEEQEWELFDCDVDPMELFNLWAEDSYAEIREHMVRLLEAKMESIGDVPAHPIGWPGERLAQRYIPGAQISSKAAQHNIPATDRPSRQSRVKLRADWLLHALLAYGVDPNPSVMSTIEDGAKEVKRSRRGCLTCRTRKVKCDETPGICNNCIALNVICRWLPVSDPAGMLSASTMLGEQASSGQIRRTACINCRRAKARCTKNDPTCARCAVHAQQCVYPSEPASRSFDSASVPIETLGTKSSMDEILDAYFAYVYPIRCNAFIHRGDLMRDVMNNIAPISLLKSIQVATARYLPTADSTHPDGGLHVAALVSEVKSAIMANTDRFSLTKLAALLNIIHHEQCSGRHASHWMLVSLAARMCMGMSLHTESAPPTEASLDTLQSLAPRWTEQETKRRLMWASFAEDSLASGGITEYMLLHLRDIKIASPCAERNFALAIPVSCRRLELVEGSLGPIPDAEDSMLVRHLRLVSIRNDLLQYTKYIQETPGRAWEAGSQFDLLLQRLKLWGSTLPPQFAFTLDNLYSLRSSPGELDQLIGNHIWYDQLHSTLYRISLPGFEESASPAYLSSAPPDWVERLRRGAYIRACEVRDKFELVIKHCPQYRPLTWRTGAFVYESIRNQLAYLHLMYPNGPTEDVRYETQRGFESMIHLLGTGLKYMSCIRKLIRELIRMAGRHGYVITSNHIQVAPETAVPSPGRGTVLPRLQSLRSHLRYPDIEHHRDTQKASTAEPVIQDPVTADIPASSAISTTTSDQVGTGHSGFNPTSLNSPLLFNYDFQFSPIRNDAEQRYTTGDSEDAQNLDWLTTVGMSSFMDEFWTAQGEDSGKLLHDDSLHGVSML